MRRIEKLLRYGIVTSLLGAAFRDALVRSGVSSVLRLTGPRNLPVRTIDHRAVSDRGGGSPDRRSGFRATSVIARRTEAAGVSHSRSDAPLFLLEILFGAHYSVMPGTRA